MWPVINSIVVDTARSATPKATSLNCFGRGQANTLDHEITGMAGYCDEVGVARQGEAASGLILVCRYANAMVTRTLWDDADACQGRSIIMRIDGMHRVIGAWRVLFPCFSNDITSCDLAFQHLQRSAQAFRTCHLSVPIYAEGTLMKSVCIMGSLGPTILKVR